MRHATDHHRGRPTKSVPCICMDIYLYYTLYIHIYVCVCVFKKEDTDMFCQHAGVFLGGGVATSVEFCLLFSSSNMLVL